MFDIRCIYCKHFSKTDGCQKNLEEEGCTSYEEIKSPILNEDKPNCEICVWQENGFCAFDFKDPLSCRRFKSLEEDL